MSVKTKRKAAKDTGGGEGGGRGGKERTHDRPERAHEADKVASARPRRPPRRPRPSRRPTPAAKKKAAADKCRATKERKKADLAGIPNKCARLTCGDQCVRGDNGQMARFCFKHREIQKASRAKANSKVASDLVSRPDLAKFSVRGKAGVGSVEEKSFERRAEQTKERRKSSAGKLKQAITKAFTGVLHRSTLQLNAAVETPTHKVCDPGKLLYCKEMATLELYQDGKGKYGSKKVMRTHLIAAAAQQLHQKQLGSLPPAEREALTATIVGDHKEGKWSLSYKIDPVYYYDLDDIEERRNAFKPENLLVCVGAPKGDLRKQHYAKYHMTVPYDQRPKGCRL